MEREGRESHLLKIPREIRNQIYAYLHRDLELRAIKKIGASQVFVSLSNTPYPSVYRVHSRLNAEYRESGPIKHVSAIIFNRNHGDDDKYWTKKAVLVHKDEIALKHIKSVTLRYSPDSKKPSADPVDLLTSLSHLAPDLRTFRIAECLIVQFYTDEPVPKHAEWAAHDMLDLLPNTIASLPLLQRANCRRITTRRVSEPNFPTCDEHVVSQCRTHLYSAHRADRDLWTAYDMVHGKMPRGFVEWTDHLSKESGIEMRAKAEQVVAWKEDDCQKTKVAALLRNA